MVTFGEEISPGIYFFRKLENFRRAELNADATAFTVFFLNIYLGHTYLKLINAGHKAPVRKKLALFYIFFFP